MRLERLLAGATVLGGAIYVLIYALYIEFYDDFGVRPEEVGWDRLAVLGRAGWVALVGIAIVVPASWIITASTDRSRLELPRSSGSNNSWMRQSSPSCKGTFHG